VDLVRTEWTLWAFQISFLSLKTQEKWSVLSKWGAKELVHHL